MIYLTQGLPATMASNFNTELILTRLVHRSARSLDDHDFDGYLEFFDNDGEYIITAKTPELSEPMVWMKQTRDELVERIQAMNEHEWEVALVEQTRILSVDTIEIKETDAEVSTSFAVYHTDQAGVTMCYAVGRYEDQWHLRSDKWLLCRREVALKTRQLHILSPLPI